MSSFGGIASHDIVGGKRRYTCADESLLATPSEVCHSVKDSDILYMEPDVVFKAITDQLLI